MAIARGRRQYGTMTYKFVTSLVGANRVPTKVGFNEAGLERLMEEKGHTAVHHMCSVHKTIAMTRVICHVCLPARKQLAALRSVPCLLSILLKLPGLKLSGSKGRALPHL